MRAMFAGKWRIITIFILIAVLAFTFTGCRSADEEKRIDNTGFFMDTKVDFSLYGVGSEKGGQVADEVFAEMNRLENIFSRHEEGSDLNRINEAAGKDWVEVEPEVITVLDKALEIADLTDGAFDPTVGPLLNLWGFGRDELRLPEQEEIEEILSLVDHRKIEIDRENSRVFLSEPGMELDLGGIAKGYIVDQGQEVALEHDLIASFVNAGGDINIRGTKPSGEGWRIGIQDPDQAAELFAVVTMEKGSIATSGDYQRYFEEDGRRYHHLLDPSDGYPAEGLSSVTIIADSAMEADVLSTAIFILGAERGRELIEEMPGIEGVIIDEARKVYLSSGIEDKIEILVDQ